MGTRTLLSAVVAATTLIAAGVAHAAPLLSWSIKTSTCTTDLTIDDAGAVTHQKTCPAATPPTSTLDEAPLSAAELDELRTNLADANQGPYTKHDPSLDSGAPYSGKVLGYSFTPPTMIAQYVAPTDASSGVVLRNEAAGAAAITRLLATRFHLDLPAIRN